MKHLFEARPPEEADGAPGDFFYDVTDLDNLRVDQYGPKASDGAWPLARTMGEEQIHRTTLPADPETGNEGDLHFTASSLELYGPKTDGFWVGPVRVEIPNPIKLEADQRAREFRENQRRLPPTWRR